MIVYAKRSVPGSLSFELLLSPVHRRLNDGIAKYEHGENCYLVNLLTDTILERDVI
jgi:hypothetical protein